MRQAAGQAVRHVVTRCGVWMHRLAQLALALVIVAVVAVGALAWRLSQGPIEMDWLARRVTDLANQGTKAGNDTQRFSIRTAALAWQGMRMGIDSPLELVLSDIAVADPRGQSLRLPRAAITLAPRPLLFGRIAVRNLDLKGVRLRLQRDENGRIVIDLASITDIADSTDPGTQTDATADPTVGNAAGSTTGLAEILAGLAAPPGGEGPLAALRSLHIHDTAIVLVDHKLGVIWRAPMAEIELNRADAGGASGRARMTLTITAPNVASPDQQQLQVDTRFALLAGGGVTLAGNLQPVVPAQLARIGPKLAPLAAVDAPITLAGTMTLDAALAPTSASLQLAAGPGTLHLGQGTMPILAASMRIEATPAKATLNLDQLKVAPRPDGPATTITAHGTATRTAGRIAANLDVAIDKVAFVDLPILWPAGIGGPGTRPWIVHNITAGVAQNAHASMTLSAPEDFSDAALTSIAGGMEAHDVTGWWLRPVPPIEHGELRLRFVDPDTIDIFATTGRQSGTGLAIQNAKIRLTGLAGRDQFMAIDANLTGPLADTLALLHHPTIAIIDKRPIPIVDPAGTIQTLLTVRMPLKNDVTFEQVAIRAVGKLTDGHLGRLAAGRDIDHANIDVDVSQQGLRITGTADVGPLPSRLDVSMDFRDGPASQVIQRVNLTAPLDPRSVARLGLNTQGVFTGGADLDFSLVDRRDGRGTMVLRLDLARAGFEAGLLNWRKDIGTPGSAEITLRTERDNPVAIERVQATAPRLELDGSADLTGGAPSLLRIRRLMMGTGTDISGEVTMPARPGQAYRVRLAGPSVDLSAALDRRAPPRPDDGKPEQPGMAFIVDAKLDRVVMGTGRQFGAVTAHLEHDGLITTAGRVDARAGDGPFSLVMKPAAGGRTLTGSAGDAGGLLRALDVMPDMRGGEMVLDARYDDAKPAHPLSGTAEISDFRIQNAPAIGRLLQAMSLYGLVEVAQGPGLGFNRLVAPFTLQDQILTLTDSRAFSASLGMTAKGRIDLRRQVAAIEGTIVPAYFFNTLLGRVPLLGKLFSPEEGGGLFAASYVISGPFADPSVRVNPLSALTPGFLRGLFDIFDDPNPTTGATSDKAAPRPPPKPRVDGDNRK